MPAGKDADDQAGWKPALRKAEHFSRMTFTAKFRIAEPPAKLISLSGRRHPCRPGRRLPAGGITQVHRPRNRASAIP